MASSTVSLNLVWCVFLISSVASESLYGRASTCLRAPSTFFPAFFILLTSSIPDRLLLLGFHDVQTHVARRTHHGAHGRVQISGVELDKLDLGNFLDSLLGDLPDLVAVRFRRTLGDASGAEQKNRGRRRLQDEGEAAVRVDGDQDRENHPVGLLLRLGIELLAEIHNVDAVGPKRGAHSGSRGGLARRELPLDGGLYLLWWHVS